MPRLLAILLLLAAFPAVAQDFGPPWTTALSATHPLVGRIWSPAEGRYLRQQDLSDRLGKADIVLLGERHDNPDHHRLQTWALEKIIAAGRHPALAFEMIGPERKAAFDSRRAAAPDDIDGLGEALDWAHSNWPDWNQYRPLFALAVAAHLPVRPANLSKETVQTIARGMPVGDDAKRGYGIDQPLPEFLFAPMAEEIRQSHCGRLPERAVSPMVDVQRARDRVMALALMTDAPEGAVLIAGAGHTRADRGVPLHLRVLAPGRPVFSLAFIEVDDDRADPASYGEAYGAATPPFDAVWFTPRATDDDPCAEMERLMQRKAMDRKSER